tara:strand:+ start:71 stop:640 length:570 start_codon:yes stop_codon:yes gene_type:complete
MLIVGLGNPGESYDNTKHNFGFWVLDLIIERCSLKWKSGYGDYVYVKSNEHIFAKPTTFMNNSGLAIKDLCRHHNQEDILVVYDDIDLHLGILRFKGEGGSGGHKGIESIIYQLGSEKFNRLKIGIALDNINIKPSEKYVLSPFPKKYYEDVKCMIIKAADSIDFYLKNTIDETMNKYNVRLKEKNNND